jgi:uncharacterized Ntn-hydrolase superfamily protein
MKRFYFCLFSAFLVFGQYSFGQDTFSIVAADSVTREVGSAGASCVNLFQFNITDPSFLGDLLPDTGAINTQAAYLQSNQANARARMREGDNPQQIISWLVFNDAQGNHHPRQYGVVGFTGSSPSAEAFTGSLCQSYANHITGSIDGIHYSIQGNILLNQAILDSMESRFRRAEGSLACRLMASLQGAKVVGADTRCASNGTSSLFAFVKVAKPTDTYGNPSFSIGVRTQSNAQIEPVDSLQVLFDALHTCSTAGLQVEESKTDFKVFPNPAGAEIAIQTTSVQIGKVVVICDLFGRRLISEPISGETTILGLALLSPGVYYLQVEGCRPQKFLKR